MIIMSIEKKKSCSKMSFKDKVNIGKQIARLEEEEEDYSERKMNRGLEESEREEAEFGRNRIDKLRDKLEGCGEDPDMYIEFGRREMIKEEESDDDESEED
jgi:hypothetical protein